MDFKIEIETLDNDPYSRSQSRVRVVESRNDLETSSVTVVVDTTAMVNSGGFPTDALLEMSKEDLRSIYNAIGFILNNA